MENLLSEATTFVERLEASDVLSDEDRDLVPTFLDELSNVRAKSPDYQDVRQILFRLDDQVERLGYYSFIDEEDL